MPAKAFIINEIESEIKEARVHEIIDLRCSFRKCNHVASKIVSMVFENGHRKGYGTCDRHATQVMTIDRDISWLEIRQERFEYD